jgi:hypothetical protein
MALRRSGWWVLAMGALIAGRFLPAHASDPEAAAAPEAVSVTVYRDPYRTSGSMDLDQLAGFALITETRVVHLQPGDNWVRFEGVADGIEPESALVTGIDGAIIEKNRDAAVLSPAALAAAALGKPVVLTRRVPGTGRVERVPGTILSNADGGVTFESAEGIEGLRCSGLPENLSFEGAEGLHAHPTLSVRVRATREVTATATLSYLARGFDWAANYTATLAADGRSMDLGAWVTLANGNGTGFPRAHAQVVAGVVNHDSGDVDPVDIGGPIIADCWPRGSTSDQPMLLQLADRMYKAAPREANAIMPMAMGGADFEEIVVTSQHVLQEQLGDLKLYRIPQPTTVASRQSKQVRLLDRTAIPMTPVYGIDLAGEEEPFGGTAGAVAASRSLRAKNTAANHLGLPLPSGHIEIFGFHQGRSLLERESDLRDLAVNEDLDIDLGPSPDVSVTASFSRPVHRIEISNARSAPIQFELRLTLPDGIRILDPSAALTTKNGRPMFALTVKAHATAVVRYRTSGGNSARGVRPL